LADEAGDVKAGQQLLTDVFTSAGVLVGVAVATFIGWAILDSLIGALVASHPLDGLWIHERERCRFDGCCRVTRGTGPNQTLIAEQCSGAL
jgi:hypothetical protein